MTKAAANERYGSPNALTISYLPRQELKAGETSVKVHATPWIDKKPRKQSTSYPPKLVILCHYDCPAFLPKYAILLVNVYSREKAEELGITRTILTLGDSIGFINE